MPPKVKITKEEIVNVALSLVRERGEQTLNARSIAAKLHCSTQPIFSNFATMDDLQQATLAAAHAYYLSFLQAEIERGRYPPYKSMGMAYIRFAKEEKELFRLLFLCDRTEKEQTPTADFEASIELIRQANRVSRERAERMHLEMWSCVHGIGTMLATSFLSLDWELISDVLSDVYTGIQTKYLSAKDTEESNDERTVQGH